MNHKNKMLALLASSLLFTGCASQLPIGGSFVDSFTGIPSCQATKIEYEYVSDPNDYWADLLKNSTEKANESLLSPEFAKACQNLKLNKTNEKTVQDVCREMACSGDKKLKFGFFDDAGTSVIAREVGNGVIEFNIAKPNSGAGSIGNIAHEFSHTLGYRHFTNFSWLGKYSVPYEVGGLVDKLSSE